MTLLFFDGLQDPILVPKPEWAATAWSAVAVGRDGTANSAGTMSTNAVKTIALSSSAAIAVAATAWRPATLPSSMAMILAFNSDLTTTQLCIVVNTSGFIELRRSTITGTLLGTSSGHSPIQAGDWHHYGMKGNLHTSTGSVTVWLDGLSVLSLTGQVTSSVIGNVTHIRISGPVTTTANWDDMYVCDTVDATATQKQANNDFLGDLRVATLLPTAAGDTTAWTPSTGANWDAVNENPPNTTDFVSSVATATGTRDLYNLSDLTGTITAVYGIRVGLYATKSDAGAALIKPVFKESGGTVTAQTSQAPANGTWGAIYGSMVFANAAGTVWTAANVNALQAGADVG